MEPLVVRVLKETRQAVLDDPGRAEAWGRYGGALHAHKLHREAGRCYERAAALDPEEFEWAYLRAVLREAEDAPPEELARLFGSAAELRPRYAPLHLRLGQALSAHGRYEEARESFLRAIELSPELAPAHRELGQALLASGEPGRALDPLRRAAELAPDDAAVHSALGRARMLTGDEDLARHSANRARRLQAEHGFPDPVVEQRVRALGASARHWFARAELRLDRGDPAGAVRDLLMVEKVRPDDPDVLYLFGVAYRGVGDGDRAKEYLSRALEIRDEHVPARLELGRVLIGEGRIDEAVEHLGRTREIAPDDPAALVSLARALARQGEIDAAIELFEEVTRLVPWDPRTRLNLGTAWLRKGDVDRAAAQFEEAVDLDPDFADARYRLGAALERLGRTDEARAHYEAAVRIDPDHPAGERLRPGGDGS